MYHDATCLMYHVRHFSLQISIGLQGILLAKGPQASSLLLCPLFTSFLYQTQYLYLQNKKTAKKPKAV
jgi:hypothetical protein